MGQVLLKAGQGAQLPSTSPSWAVHKPSGSFSSPKSLEAFSSDPNTHCSYTTEAGPGQFLIFKVLGFPKRSPDPGLFQVSAAGMVTASSPA